ncbi:ExeM/NucH family extracellular endonuclease [Cellulomonas citrea]|uniref:ExeM/NucH family extracellular endonuclease n=1 Tax=Cellulomonas citrea TaxID=1909423 RepID=UPI0019150D67|nr:ExeM/NucH family extracellular endonuclease [Cellulomonas citrea]
MLLTHPWFRRSAALSAAVAGALVLPASLPAFAAVSTGSPVVINEIYGAGGNSGSTLTHDFIELANVSDAPVDVSTWSVQYASSAGTSWSGVVPLTGSIPAHSTYLVQAASQTGASTVSNLPTPNASSSTVNLSATKGSVALVSSTTALSCATTACAGATGVVDLVGYGAAGAYAGAGPATAPSTTTSISRTSYANTADNAADFVAGAPTPTAATTTPVDPTPTPTATPTVDPTTPADTTLAISEIQGTGAQSPLVGQKVVTTGVITALYPTGGLNGFVIQTPGTGGTLDASHTASDAVFVYQPSGLGSLSIGEDVTVTGTVAEYNGLTEINATSTVARPGTVAPVTPVVATWPTTDAAREALESMLLAPAGDFTVSNTYSTNQYGEVGLASGSTPLRQPTDVARPGTAEAAAVAADNAARGVVLDDGATTNFLSSANSGLTPPYISLTDPVRVGAKVTFDQPVIVDYRNSTWKLNPTSQVTSTTPAGQRAQFSNTRTAAPDATKLGAADLKIASFNVLNYFTTLGSTVSGCTSYKDRAGTPITVNSCPGNGPRGAWDAASLARQQAKIVAAINATDADVVGLMEIENSAVLGEPVDSALSTLVAALNAADSSAHWAYVPSSTELPALSAQDVITNALIYRTDAVSPLGASHALGTASGAGQAFDNAREPIGQAFTPAGGGDPFFVVVNHFKSKGSAGPLPGDTDAGDGQGASNASRVAQANALAAWVPTVLATYSTPVTGVALVGDFNSYSQEDPIAALATAGYTDVTPHFDAGEYSYSFDGLAGSLDHVLVNDALLARSTGSDIWSINSAESIALEYSRYNYHGTLFYDASPYRSSDHDPVILGITAKPAPTTTDLTLLNLNDFHGRIDANTVNVAGTIEQERAAKGEDNTVLLSAGDNIGATLFASSIAKDQPTIDVLNALGLKASAVGNHEFDQGFADLKDRVSANKTNAAWDYLGANVYLKGTTTPALPEYSILDVAGKRLAVIGAVTQETSALVSPGGIAGLDFGDPVDAVNRVVAQLSDGNEANGEADVFVAEYHDGAGAGTPDGATLAQEIAAGGPFAKIVTATDAKVSAIFTGHTHKQYAWDAPVPGSSTATRPVLQTGSYGEFLGEITLTVDNSTNAVTAYTAKNVARTKTPAATLVATYPRVAAVKTIVDKALANAAAEGNKVIGKVSADITTAFKGTARDDRASESTLGDLVADSLRTSLSDPLRGGADIGVVNPGGLRSELYAKQSSYSPAGPAADGDITYAQANAVLPFLNNLWTVSLTGAQFTTLLEQQWQTNPDGTVPSRPYLQLGLSKNVTYTYDPAAAAGHHITSVTINGKPLDPAASYRIGTFSFLAQGGDNFRVFTSATQVRDSGLVDRDAWISYLTANQPVSPSFARRAVQVTGQPTAATQGDDLSFGVAGLDLTSLGSPATTSLVASWVGSSQAPVTVPVSAGAATVALPVPYDVLGAATLQLVAAPTGTTVTIPVQVASGGPIPAKAPGRAVLSSDNGWDTGLLDGDYTITSNLWWGQNGTRFRLYENGVLVGEVKLSDHTPLAQVAQVHLSGRVNGTYVYTGELVNAKGTTATSTLTVRVKDANPGAVVLSNDNWDRNGSYTVSADKWWGTAATTYRLYEDDVLIDTQSLSNPSVYAQHASTVLTGRAVGTHTYRAELANAAGVTSSKVMKVTVSKP